MYFKNLNELLDTEEIYRHKIHHLREPYKILYGEKIFENDKITGFRVLVIGLHF